MDKWLTLDDAVQNCDYISIESKPIVIYQLHNVISLYKQDIEGKRWEFKNLDNLNDQKVIEAHADAQKARYTQARALIDDLNDGIKAAKKLKKVALKIARNNSVLFDALDEFIKKSEINIKVETPKPLNKRGGRVDKSMHKLGLSFKSVWEFYASVKVDNPEAVKVAVLFFVEAGISFDRNLNPNEVLNKVSKLFKRQLNGKSKITPYLQIVEQINK